MNHATDAQLPAGGTRFLTSRRDIIQALKVFRDSRNTMALRLDGDHTTYTARILDVLEADYLLEDVQPRPGPKGLEARVPFSLAGRAPGTYLFVDDNVVTAADAERGIPFFRVRLPEQVIFQQRSTRSAPEPLRVRLPGASLVLFRPQGNVGEGSLVGRVLELDAAGARADFDGDLAGRLSLDSVIDRCDLIAPKVVKVQARATVRSVDVSPDGARTLCTIEFSHMPVTDRRRLEHWIELIARTHRNTT